MNWLRSVAADLAADLRALGGDIAADARALAADLAADFAAAWQLTPADQSIYRYEVATMKLIQD